MFGGKKFIAKMIPCHRLNADFMYDCVNDVMQLLHQCGARVIAIVNDNNRVNQTFFSKFSTFNSLTPWIVRSVTDPRQPVFLLYDPIHIVKNLRNNWVTEKEQTLVFYHPETGEQMTAKWTDLVDLYNHEQSTMNGLYLSKLTKASVSPSNLEKQKVSLALNVFCDATVAALRTSQISTESCKQTAECIALIVQLFKIFNTKTVYQAKRFNDPDRVALDLTESGSRGFEILSAWSKMATKMRPSSVKREKQLTAMTAEAVKWTCESLQCLAHFLLTTDEPINHQNVCLGFFLQDDLERHFGYFRMACGSNYYLTVQDIFCTHSIDKTKMMLDNVGTLEYGISEHKCELCDKDISDEEICILDDMVTFGLEGNLSKDQKLAIFYLAGYVAFKHPELSRTTLRETRENSAFLDSVSRGKLTCPSDIFLHFVFLAFYFFPTTSVNHCRKRLTTILSTFPEKFSLDISVPKKALHTLANIFFKKYGMNQSLKSNTIAEQSRRKLAKLSSSTNSSSTD